MVELIPLACITIELDAFVLDNVLGHGDSTTNISIFTIAQGGFEIVLNILEGIALEKD
jgi:hypothetical protein